MSLRLAILLAASLLALGGCAQDELAVIGQILPTDIIFDAPAAAAPNDDVVRAADTGWGDATVYRGRCPKCLRTIEFKVGDGGTDSRSFVVH